MIWDKGTLEEWTAARVVSDALGSMQSKKLQFLLDSGAAVTHVMVFVEKPDGQKASVDRFGKVVWEDL